MSTFNIEKFILENNCKDPNIIKVDYRFIKLNLLLDDKYSIGYKLTIKNDKDNPRWNHIGVLNKCVKLIDNGKKNLKLIKFNNDNINFYINKMDIIY